MALTVKGPGMLCAAIGLKLIVCCALTVTVREAVPTAYVALPAAVTAKVQVPELTAVITPAV